PGTMDVSGMDNGSIHIMMNLLREDISSLRESDKGKYPEDELPDWKLALNTLESELASLESILADRSLCMRIARAVAVDGEPARAEQRAGTQTAAPATSLNTGRADRSLSIRVARAVTVDGDSARAEQRAKTQTAAPATSLNAGHADCMRIARAITVDGDPARAEQRAKTQTAAPAISLNTGRADQSLRMRILRAVAVYRDPARAKQRAETQTTAPTTSSNTGHATQLQVQQEEASTPPTDDKEEELTREFPTLCNVYAEENEEGEAKSSSRAASRASKETVQPFVTCICCGDAGVSCDMVRSPCGHEYCRDCLAKLFEASIEDESLFPPRCCKQPFEIEEAQIFLPDELVCRFKTKKVEFESSDRTYCWKATCSSFIPIQSIRDGVAHCSGCCSTTCAICKQESHKGDCPQDPVNKEFYKVATDNKWQRCKRCKRYIELNIGCNHITCLCGAEFCYICGVAWKTCYCQIWDENRLLHRAAEFIDRGRIIAGNAADAAERARLVREEADFLAQNHVCFHRQWERVEGRNQCEECSYWLDQFILECRQCGIRVCGQCRRNRL
ncbi:hypothetical protein CP532_5557, partial [Ophiocordyceps camponoti-leonardi (nom. inval.)]